MPQNPYNGPVSGMRRVVIESPLAGDWSRNIRFAQYAMLDSFLRGEAPFASHLLYPQCLDDTEPEQRLLGMSAGFAWGAGAELCAVYDQLGTSPGMRAGIERAQALNIPVEFRALNQELKKRFDRGLEVYGERKPV